MHIALVGVGLGGGGAEVEPPKVRKDVDTPPLSITACPKSTDCVRRREREAVAVVRNMQGTGRAARLCKQSKHGKKRP